MQPAAPPCRAQQPVHACQDQALDGSRYIGEFAFADAAQQLFQEHRIAFGALDAVVGDAMGYLDQVGCQQLRIFCRSGPRSMVISGLPCVEARQILSSGSPSHVKS